MIPPFDIFRTETEGGVQWLEAAATLEEALGRIRAIGGPSSREYLVLNQKTGQRLAVKVDESLTKSRIDS
jgi:hypothetical protein